MKVSIIKDKGKKEIINRHELGDVALFIKNGWREKAVREIRLMYHLMNPQRADDGRVLTNFQGGIKLERICFARDIDNYKGRRRVLGYNGLGVLEVNGLPTFEKAVEVRN